MAKEFLMKELLVSLGIFASATLNAESLPDSVVMSVGDKDVSISEFIYMARKNAEVDLSDKSSLRNYVELFKNFKLKVAEAESLGLDKTPTFKKEYEEYKNQLLSSYLSDKDGERAAAKEIYDRGNEYVELSHILFRLPEKTLSKDTLSVYQEALDVYNQIKCGEDIDKLGAKLSAQNRKHIASEHVRCLFPMQTIKAFEEAAYTLPLGEVSMPVRTKLGFHIIKVHSRKQNPGRVKVAHILFAYPKDGTKEDTLAIKDNAYKIYHRIKSGEDLALLAREYSSEKASAKNGGELPLFGYGEMVEPFEKAAFSLSTPGEISTPVETQFGYHIVKLLDKIARPSFDDEYNKLSRKMGQGERNFELYRAFDERLKSEYGYIFYPEAYAELEALCNDYFPSDREFYEKAKDMKRTLLHLAGYDLSQSEFAYYMVRNPFSTKSYAGDFMHEVYDLFVRDIITTAERKNMERKHPEIPHLLQEYRDGMLLFEISNREIWNKPADQQDELEKRWVDSLNKKYHVVINWKLLKNISK